MGIALPGVRVGFRAEPREVLLSNSGVITVAAVVDADRSVDGRSPTEPFDLRPGWLMGQIASTGRWTPCKRTRVASSGTSAVVPVDDASAFRPGDVVTVGTDADLTVVAVDYAENELTVASSFTFASGEAAAAQDGSQTCRGILLDFVRLRDESLASPMHKAAALLIAGFVNRALVLGDLAAVRLDAGAKLGGVRFSDEHGL
jgi:hypothetical protein